jgi:hypothetical protein
MGKRLKINTVLISALTLLFYAFFMFSTHNPALAAANPFGQDPFDAIGKFDVEAAAFLLIPSWIRLFMAYARGNLSPKGRSSWPGRRCSPCWRWA